MIINLGVRFWGESMREAIIKCDAFLAAFNYF
jgi:hypothetical protein